MARNVREFLETYDLYTRFHPHDGAWWDGDWPDVVQAQCRLCGEPRPHRMWPTRVAGFTLEWGVYMIHGACEFCGNDSLIFWVEVNQREGWMRKAGQLPAGAVVDAAVTTAPPACQAARSA
jgi:hypothetical protein